MEASYILRCQFESPEMVSFVQTMFSEDAPIFAEDVDFQFHAAFDALEECCQPESVEKVSSDQLEIAWLTGSDMFEDIQDTVNCIVQAGAIKVVGYYWADETEAFFTCKGKKTTNVKSWRKQFKDVLIENSDHEIAQCLSILMEY